uniref:Cytochrome c oxidase subunit 2 n=1 Tax=Diplectrona hexapetala (nom. nud.) TaxID=2904920 RepID=A0A9E8RSK9_9NEOP|nr:cytochrome c oxidase subunit II [Diplectrona hexapetala (nom. nud.)]UZZ43859.1 cytochrome c oxidase subunit II [Diplectrona hexapetala (nom. nud.)]
MPTWSNLNLQNSNSPLMEQLIFFHDNTMLIVSMITTFVLFMMLSLIYNKTLSSNIIENQSIELLWTIIPSFFLIAIALPSLHLLYLMDETNKPLLTLKIIGHQWYWSYEYSDFKNIEFDSYMTPLTDSKSFRLLDVDNRIILPYNTQIRSLMTSSDTIHAWTIPSLGIKNDAIPGRLNQANFSINHSGISFGQCSEICGTNHSFMPIVVETVHFKTFLKWINLF